MTHHLHTDTCVDARDDSSFNTDQGQERSQHQHGADAVFLSKKSRASLLSHTSIEEARLQPGRVPQMQGPRIAAWRASAWEKSGL